MPTGAQDKTVLVCGASNLAVDNLLERLTAHHVPVTRIGHPARVLSTLHSSTLDYQTAYSDAGMIVRDIKKELEQAILDLQKGKIRGSERYVGYRLSNFIFVVSCLTVCKSGARSGTKCATCGRNTEKEREPSSKASLATPRWFSQLAMGEWKTFISFGISCLLLIMRGF
jgi:hypothetical protein